MKKFYILALSLLAMSAAQAQTIKIVDSKGNEVPDNSTVTVTTYNTDQTEEDDTPGYFYYFFDSGLSMIGSETGEVTVRGELVEKRVTGLNDSDVSYQVCPNGSCTNFKDGVAINTSTYDASKGEMELAIHMANYGTPTNELVLYSQADFTVFYTGKGSTAKHFTLIFDFDYNKTGVSDIVADSSNAAPVYFNLNGARVDSSNLTPGLYIRRQGNKATKTIIK